MRSHECGARPAQNHPHFWIAAKCSPATPRGGNTGACAGKTITGNQATYKSNPDFHGVDTFSYEVVNPDGKRGSMHVTINAK
jgi:hypothetical protein